MGKKSGGDKTLTMALIDDGMKDPLELLLEGIVEELLAKPPVRSTRISEVGIEDATANAKKYARADWERAIRGAMRKSLEIKGIRVNRLLKVPGTGK
jgi:hypothetical protein